MASGAIPILKLGSTLLATIQIDLHDTVVDTFQNDVLEEIEKTGANGLIIDISALETVDSYVARMLANTGKMAKLMGSDTVIVGMRPAVSRHGRCRCRRRWSSNALIHVMRCCAIAAFDRSPRAGRSWMSRWSASAGRPAGKPDLEC